MRLPRTNTAPSAISHRSSSIVTSTSAWRASSVFSIEPGRRRAASGIRAYVNRRAEHVRRVHRPIIAKDHQRKQPLLERFRTADSPREMGHDRGVEHDEVGLL